jgi:hypothetical protein
MEEEDWDWDWEHCTIGYGSDPCALTKAGCISRMRIVVGDQDQDQDQDQD